MSNFEMKYTVRLYDPDLVLEVEKLHETYSREFRNKNEFMTRLIRIGVEGLRGAKPNTSFEKSSLPAIALDKLNEEMCKIKNLFYETGEFLKVQSKKAQAHIAVMEKMLASLYNMNLGELSGTPPIPRKVEDGFFDDLPERFAKLIVTLESGFGTK